MASSIVLSAQENIPKHSAVVTLTQIAHIATLFLADIMIVKVFGASRQLDGYLIIYSIHQLLGGVIAGIVQSTFIPYWLQERNDYQLDWLFVSRTANNLFAAVFIVCLIVIIFKMHIVGLLAPRFQLEYHLTMVNMLIIFSISVIFLAMSEIFQGLLRANFFFLSSGLGIALRNTTLFVGLLFLDIRTVVFLSVLFLFGTILQTIYSFLCVLFLLKPKYYLSFGFRDSRIREVFRKACFPAGSQLMTYGRVLVERMLAGFLAPGGVTIVAYARKLFNIFMVFAVQGVQVASSPALSIVAFQKDEENKERTLEKSIEFAAFMAVILTFIPLALGQDLVSLVLQRGKFTPQAVQLTAGVLAIFLLGIPINAIGRILTVFLYSLRKQELVFGLTLISMSVTILIQWMLLRKFGVYGMGIGNTIGLFLGGIFAIYLSRRFCRAVVSFSAIFKKVSFLALIGGLSTCPLWMLQRKLVLSMDNVYIAAAAISLIVLLYWYLVWRSGVTSVPAPGIIFRIIKKYI